MPITDMSLIRQRRMFKRAFEECGEVPDRCSKLRILEAVVWFADKASKFVRDVETGCSLAHYGFLNPFVRLLLQRKAFKHEQVLQQGSQTIRIEVVPILIKELGVKAWIQLRLHNDGNESMPLMPSATGLELEVQLWESTDITGITIDHLQMLLGPRFDKSFAKGAVGQLVAYQHPQDYLSLIDFF
uniref:Uncharacterized protein n=1 Tax=Oryza punctata TaxID=4537 RepID=A0A0E0JL21_ORYPU